MPGVWVSRRIRKTKTDLDSPGARVKIPLETFYSGSNLGVTFE